MNKIGAGVNETPENVNNNSGETASRTESGHELERGLPEDCLSGGCVNRYKNDNESEILEEKQQRTDVNRCDEEDAKGGILFDTPKGTDVSRSNLDVNRSDMDVNRRDEEKANGEILSQDRKRS